MKIAVISGSEKSGKTFIATNLASVSNYAYFDCNFAKPQAPLYFEQNNKEESEHFQTVTNINLKNCNNCFCCLNECKKNAASKLEDDFSFNSALCFDCDECTLLDCNAKKQEEIFLGKSFNYTNEKVKVYYGQISYPNKENALFSKIANCHQFTNVYIDLPGKMSAFSLHVIKNCDYCLIVEDPSSFNFDDFKGCLRAVKLLSKPYGIVFNKAYSIPPQFSDYCSQQNANILTTIPNYIKEEKLISDCKILSRLKLTHKQSFASLHQQIKKK